MINFIVNVFEQGSLYAILSIGVMISYKIIGLSDLSVDGTYPLGAVVSAVLIMGGMSPWLALFVSFVAGVLAGSVTGILHVKLKISSLLSGILVMTGLYSINLMIAGGKSNLPLLNERNLFDGFNFPYARLIVLVSMVILIKFLVDWLLNTKLGYLLKVTGDNEGLVTGMGHDVGAVKIIGLSLSNGLVALSGGVAASVGKYYDITLGTGMVVMGLSSVMLGTLLLKRFSVKDTTMVIVGSIAYRFIVALAIRFGLDPQHMKLVTVIIFVVAIVLNNGGFRMRKGA